MRRVAIFLPDGVGLRNYLFSSLVRRIVEQDAEVVILTSISRAPISEAEKLHGLKFWVVPVPQYREDVLEKFYRELENISRLRLFSQKLKNPTIIPNHEWRHLTKYKGLVWLFYFLIRFVSRYTVNYNTIKNINKRYFNRVSKSDYLSVFVELIKEVRPDVILCTHQRAISATPLFVAAQKIGVTTITAIYSWDNPPKARMTFRADKYLVWSQHMKSELLFFYPELNPANVIITGTPQFEFYRRDDLLLSFDDFRMKYGFDLKRPIICYSGGDRLTSPYDQDYLNDLAVALKAVPENERPQILFRRCPVDWSDRFDRVIEEHKDIIREVNPLWAFEKDEREEWSLTYPLFSDVKLLVNVARHCDLVYNVGSTMAHDYSMFNKPACYINYNPQNAVNGYSIRNLYNYQHFRSMPSPDAVVWVNSKNEIADVVMEAIRNPDKVAPARKSWLEKIVLHPVTDASGNIANLLING